MAVPHIQLCGSDNPNMVLITKEVTSRTTGEKIRRDFAVHLDITEVKTGVVTCTISYPLCCSFRAYTVLSNDYAKVFTQNLLDKLQSTYNKPLKLSDFSTKDESLKENLKCAIKKVEDPFVLQEKNTGDYIDTVCIITKISIAISPGDMLMEKNTYETDDWFEMAYSSMLLDSLLRLLSK